MMHLEPCILLITGIMASGKSTIAQAVAERLDRSAHVRGDTFRRMIVGGRREMEPDEASEAWEQLRLRYRIAAMVASAYYQAGFTAVYQDIIIGPILNDVINLFANLPLYVVVLCPSPEVVAQREAGRNKTGYGEWTPEQLDAELRSNTPRIGLWLDTSSLSIDETADTILARLDEAHVTTL